MSVRLLLAAALLAPALALAQAPAESGPLFALRGGAGLPDGRVARGGPVISDLVERKFPLGFEVGYRLSGRFWAQLGFELAPATPAPALCAATACSASAVRVGAQLVMRLLPGAWLDPWVGAGVGVEVLNAEGRDAASGARTEWSWAGVELPFLEAGADVALSDRIALGPWASISFARYTSDSVRVGEAAAVSGAVRGRALHRWVSGGLQATLKL